MLKSIRKALLFGLGALDLSREKLTEGVNEFLEEEKINKKEGRKLVDEVLKKAEKQKKVQQKNLKKLVKDVMGELEVATKKDLETLKKMETTKVVSDMLTHKKKTRKKSKKRKAVNKKPKTSSES